MRREFRTGKALLTLPWRCSGQCIPRGSLPASMQAHERPDAAVLVGLDQYLGPVAVAKGQSIAPLILELEQRYGGLVEGHGFFL